MALTHVIAQVKRSTQGAHLGQFREMEVKTDKLALLIRIVTDRYFLVLGVSPEGNLGKARYLLRLLSPQILAQL